MVDVFAVRYRTSPKGPWTIDEWAETRKEVRQIRAHLLKTCAYGHRYVLIRRITIEPTGRNIAGL